MRVESSRYQLTSLLFAKLSWPLGGETELAVACGRCLGGLFERAWHMRVEIGRLPQPGSWFLPQRQVDKWLLRPAVGEKRCPQAG